MKHAPARGRPRSADKQGELATAVLHVRIAPRLARKLQATAERRKRSASELVREAIERIS